MTVLDGSSVDTYQIVQRLAQDNSKIELRSASDDGQYDALLLGICETDCDRISWLNAGDLYPPWAIVSANRTFEEMDADWISGLPRLWDSEGTLRAV